MSDALKRTALYPWHKSHGARLVPFAGWEMPVQYPTGPLQEHLNTRQAAGLFDIDHMGQIEVRGADAETFVNRMVSYDVRRMDTLDAHYALLCYQDGGVVDDLFVYRLPATSDTSFDAGFLLVVNASNRGKDYRWLTSFSAGMDLTVTDISDETYMLALQGPLAPAILDRVTSTDLSTVKRFTAVQDRLWGRIPALIGRTGYTGEDGFELFFPFEEALAVWEGLLREGKGEGLLPVGLAARDSLRFEPCFPLYGQEIDAFHTPVQAGLGFAVSLNKPFVGREVLLKQKLEGPAEVLVGFEMQDKGVPRHGYPVTYQGLDVGQVTSGMFAPSSRRYLGMAYLPAELAAPGTEIEIIVHGSPKTASVVDRPFYLPAYRR